VPRVAKLPGHGSCRPVEAALRSARLPQDLENAAMKPPAFPTAPTAPTATTRGRPKKTGGWTHFSWPMTPSATVHYDLPFGL
jgi:hypothetical protein